MNEIYKGVLIEYDEDNNTWNFSLRSRDRAADSLKGAREIIDKPVVEKQAKDFKPIDGWIIDWSGCDAKPGRITSFALPRYGQKRIRFIETDDSGKCKPTSGATLEDLEKFFPRTPENILAIGHMKAQSAEIQRLSTLRDKTRSGLTKLDKSVVPD